MKDLEDYELFQLDANGNVVEPAVVEEGRRWDSASSTMPTMGLPSPSITGVARVEIRVPSG